MCGRFTLKKPPAELTESHAGSSLKSVAEWKARYNIAPTQNALIIRRSQPKSEALELSSMRWGLIPSWAKSSDSTPLINARAETLADKPSFKAAYQKRRCLVPADGFYEWKRNQRVNQPYYFQLEDHSQFYMAGLWENWGDANGNELESFTIITTRANSLLSKYHDRMPVILDNRQKNDWLGNTDSPLAPSLVNELLVPYASRKMIAHPVSSLVNYAKNDNPSCIEENTTDSSTQLDLGL